MYIKYIARIQLHILWTDYNLLLLDGYDINQAGPPGDCW